MEKALRYELETHIPELKGLIYPTNAPIGVKKPYLVYARINTDTDKNYSGFTNYEKLSYMFSIMAVDYAVMKSLTDKVETLLKSIIQTSIGAENTFIQNVTINNISEAWESELEVNRGIVDFTISH